MKVAVVGCGQIADAHIQEVRRIPGAVVEAVCDSNPHMAEQAAERFEVPQRYTDADRMLTDVRPEVVHITTPPESHLAIGRLAISHGAHAYIEKPFTATVAEAEELVAAATRAGVLVCAGHSNAFDPAYLRLRALCDEGVLGDVVHVDAAMGYSLTGPFGSAMMSDPAHWVHRLPGGLTHNNIPHPVSLLLPFLPGERPRVVARGQRLRPERYGDVRDRFMDELRVMLFSGSSSASLVFSCRTRPIQLYAAVSGTRAQAIASIDGRTVQIVRGASMPGPFAKVQWTHQAYRQSRGEFYGSVKRLLRADLHFFGGMHELIRRLYLAIEGKGEMPVPMAEALRTTRVIEDIVSQCRLAEEEA